MGRLRLPPPTPLSLHPRPPSRPHSCPPPPNPCSCWVLTELEVSRSTGQQLALLEGINEIEPVLEAHPTSSGFSSEPPQGWAGSRTLHRHTHVRSPGGNPAPGTERWSHRVREDSRSREGNVTGSTHRQGPSLGLKGQEARAHPPPSRPRRGRCSRTQSQNAQHEGQVPTECPLCSACSLPRPPCLCLCLSVSLSSLSLYISL